MAQERSPVTMMGRTNIKPLSAQIRSLAQIQHFAPLNIGQNVLIAAGSTVTDDVSSNSKVFARARQITKVKQEEI